MTTKSQKDEELNKVVLRDGWSPSHYCDDVMSSEVKSAADRKHQSGRALTDRKL